MREQEGFPAIQRRDAEAPLPQQTRPRRAVRKRRRIPAHRGRKRTLRTVQILSPQGIWKQTPLPLYRRTRQRKVQEAAKEIADYTGGTLAEIQRATPYEDVNTEGEEELNSNARPEITISVDNVEEYDTIFVGYPIWWDEAPMVISTFLESYDFTDKRIIPFCTSASDSIDNSLHIFEELAPDATIEEGLTANEEEDIEPWLNELGFEKAD